MISITAFFTEVQTQTRTEILMKIVPVRFAKLYYLAKFFKSDEDSIDNMEKKRGRFVFKKEDLKIELEDGTGYFVNPETDICLYKIPHRPDEKGEEFYMTKHKNMAGQHRQCQPENRKKQVCHADIECLCGMNSPTCPIYIEATELRAHCLAPALLEAISQPGSSRLGLSTILPCPATTIFSCWINFCSTKTYTRSIAATSSTAPSPLKAMPARTG